MREELKGRRLYRTRARSSRDSCPRCSCPILIGESIRLRKGYRGWVHVGCTPSTEVEPK